MHAKRCTKVTNLWKKSIERNERRKISIKSMKIWKLITQKSCLVNLSITTNQEVDNITVYTARKFKSFNIPLHLGMMHLLIWMFSSIGFVLSDNMRLWGSTTCYLAPSDCLPYTNVLSVIKGRSRLLATSPKWLSTIYIISLYSLIIPCFSSAVGQKGLFMANLLLAVNDPLWPWSRLVLSGTCGCNSSQVWHMGGGVYAHVRTSQPSCWH